MQSTGASQGEGFREDTYARRCWGRAVLVLGPWLCQSLLGLDSPAAGPGLTGAGWARAQRARSAWPEPLAPQLQQQAVLTRQLHPSSLCPWALQTLIDPEKRAAYDSIAGFQVWGRGLLPLQAVES